MAHDPPRVLVVDGHSLALEGDRVLVDGAVVALAARQATLLSALVESEGRVLSKGDLLREVWGEGDADEHAVEMAVTRLRRALGPAGPAVETVVKRGYRLRVG